MEAGIPASGGRMTIELIDLGWCIGKLDVENSKLTLVSPSDEDNGFYVPAESIAIFGRKELIRLREVLQKMEG